MSVFIFVRSLAFFAVDGGGAGRVGFMVVRHRHRADRHVLVMLVLAINRQWVVDGGGAMLVGNVVIDVVDLLTVCQMTTDDVVVVVVVHLHCTALRPWHAPVVVFHGHWSSCASRCLCCVHVPLLLGSRDCLLGGCCCFAAGVVSGGGGCVTWHEGGVLGWWWLWDEERSKCHSM